MHAIAHGGCTDTVREAALEVDSGRKNPLPHLGLKPASVLRLGFSVGRSTNWAILSAVYWDEQVLSGDDDGPLLSFQERSSSASSSHASRLQAISGVMSLALYPQVVSQAPQHFRSS